MQGHDFPSGIPVPKYVYFFYNESIFLFNVQSFIGYYLMSIIKQFTALKEAIFPQVSPPYPELSYTLLRCKEKGYKLHYETQVG